MASKQVLQKSIFQLTNAQRKIHAKMHENPDEYEKYKKEYVRIQSMLLDFEYRMNYE